MTGLDGVRQRRLALPPGTGIANGVAWSPDGRMIATVPWLSRTGPPPPEAQRQPWSGKPDELAIHFTDANGNRLAEPRPVTGKLLLGWKSSRSIITISYDFLPRERDTATIEEIDLATGKAAVLSKVDHGHACEFFMEACLAQEFQLATGLIDRMG